MNEKEAIDIVAWQLLRNAAEAVQWEDMPDIGQYDFERLSDRMLEIAPEQPQWDQAITFLENRAEEPT